MTGSIRAPGALPGTDDITVLRAVLVAADRYQQQTWDWDHATSHVVHGCSVQALTTTEDIDQREYITTRLRVFAPPGADILYTDRIVWAGTTYEVDGDPFVWTDDTGHADHTELIAKRWQG